MTARFLARLLFAGVALFFLSLHSEAKIQPQRAAQKWTSLAREVGQSEEHRDRFIQTLRHLPHLSTDLRVALSSKTDRPLALEVIDALNLQNLLPDLVARVQQDNDGFTAVAVNGLMTEKSSRAILQKYASLLEPSKISHLSAPVIVALLEPLGRLNTKLPRATLLRLSKDASPDVRSALLYYLRVMALKNSSTTHLDLVTDMTRAPEVQLRLQAISVTAEIDTSRHEFKIPALKTLSELNTLCLREAGSTLKEACLSFLAVNVARR